MPYKRRRVVRRPRRGRVVKRRAIARIARNVVLRQAEHKFRNVEVGYTTLRGGTIYAINPLYWIAVDNTSLGRTGAKIQNVKLKLRFSYLHNGVQAVTGATPWAKSQLRVMVFKHNKEWRNATENTMNDISGAFAGGVGTAISNTEILLDGANSERMTYCFPNLKDVRVLADKTYTTGYTSAHGNGSNTLFPAQPGIAWHTFDVKLGSIEYQSGQGTSLTKNDQVYVAFMASAINPSPQPADDVGAVLLNYGVSYTDM